MAAPSEMAKPPVSAHRRGLTIHQKLLALILLLVGAVVALLAIYLPSRQIASLRAELDAKALTYSRLVAKEVAPAVAFDDQETAREVFDSVAEDADVRSLTLLGARGTVLSARGDATSEVVERRGLAPGLHVTPDRVIAVAPVVSLEGPRGTLIVELTLRRLTEQRKVVQQNALGIGLVALLLGGLGASFIAVSLGRRLRAIGRVAEAVGAGELEQPAVEVRGRLDEIGMVALAFNAMLAHIRDLVAQIRRSAEDEQRRLAALVAERTRDLDQRNADLTRVLDNVGQGFVTLDRDGRMSRERSRVLGEWFGAGAECESFADLLATVEPELGEWFTLGWQSIAEDFLPLEVCLQQLPRRITANGRELGLEYRSILARNGELEQVLVVVSDLTDALKRSRAEADEREVTSLFSKLIADRSGLVEFVWEAQTLVEHVAEGARTHDLTLLKRALHTLKGNVGLYGVETVAALCHGLEERLADNGRLGADDIEPLCRRWSDVSKKVQTLLDDRADKIELDDEEHAELLGAIDRGVSRAEIRRRVQAWRLEPAEARLSRIAAQASAFADRLGKGPIRVEVAANHVRIEREGWAEFWAACVHVVRNAVDHGLETPDERERLGKSVPATLRLQTAVVGDRFQIEFKDDGRGVDWSRVRKSAEALGLPHETSEELEEALFADGLSTRGEASEVSGRGIGLPAVRQACEKIGGTVELESSPGRGTTFRFVWPQSVAFVPHSSRSTLPGRPNQDPAATVVGVRV